MRSRTVQRIIAHRPIAFTKTCDIAYHVMSLQVEGCDLLESNHANESLVHNAKNRYKVTVLRLRDELREDADVVQRALGIGEAHVSVHEVDWGQPECQ